MQRNSMTGWNGAAESTLRMRLEFTTGKLAQFGQYQRPDCVPNRSRQLASAPGKGSDEAS